MNKKLFLLPVFIAAALVIGTAAPVLAEGQAQVGGEPELQATVLGTCEFTAGQSGALQLAVLNTGLFSGQTRGVGETVMDLGISQVVGNPQVPPYTTASGITVALTSASDAVQVVSGPVGIGTLPVGMSAAQPVVFQLRIAKNAPAGSYQLEAKFDYQFLDLATVLSTTSPLAIQYNFDWSEKTQVLEIPIKVVATNFAVMDLQTDAVRAGDMGTITATIKNSGSMAATEVTAKIATGGSFVPVDQGVFLGKMDGGQSKTAAFKVSVSPEAMVKTYPLDVVINYKDENYIARQVTLSAGIPIDSAQDDFLVTNVKTDGIRAGTTGIITMSIKNDAAGEVHDVTAEMVPGEYFIPVDKGSFLGNMKQGDSITTQFKASVSQDAIAKASILHILVKYYNQNNVPGQIQLTVGVPVEVKSQFEIGTLKVNGKLTPGAQRVIETPIKNASNSQIMDATSRINLVDPFSTAPFSTSQDTAYLGTLKPGDTGTGKFKISVDSDAVPKSYTVEVQVKYWDSLGNSYTSEAINAVVTVQPTSGLQVWMIVLIVVAVLVVLGIIAYSRRRSKSQAQSK
jgi:hypothetical protein